MHSTFASPDDLVSIVPSPQIGVTRSEILRHFGRELFSQLEQLLLP